MSSFIVKPAMKGSIEISETCEWVKSRVLDILEIYNRSEVIGIRRQNDDYYVAIAKDPDQPRRHEWIAIDKDQYDRVWLAMRHYEILLRDVQDQED